MSRSDSEGRAGRRRSRRSGGSRGRRDDSGRDTRPGHDPGTPGSPDDSSPDQEGVHSDEVRVAEAGDSAADPAARSRRSGRGGARRSRKRGAGARHDDAPTGGSRRAASPSEGLDPLSKFSASALRRVSVLGDGPNNVVHSLAERSRRKSVSVVLGALLSLSGVALLALLGVLVYQLVYLPSGTTSEGAQTIVEPPAGHTTVVPEVYNGETTSKDLFEPIEERPDNAEPLSDKKVFGSDAEELKLDDLTLGLQDSDTTDTCTAMVWGGELQQSLADGSCASAARGVYRDTKKDYVAQFTLFDMTDTGSASDAATALDPMDPGSESGFVLPLDDGVTGLRKGYSQATTQVMGHYTAVFWVARADGKRPKGDDSLAKVNVVAMDAAVSVYEELRDTKESRG